MAAFSTTDYDAMLKDYYTPEEVLRLTLTDNILLGMLPKKRAGGRRYIQPVNFGHPGGAAATFATAQSNAYGSRYDDFQLTRAKQYQFVLLENEVYFASEGDLDAFEPAFNEFDKGFQSLAYKINRRLYRDVHGSVGKIATGGISGSTITLDDPADAFNVWKGDKIELAATLGGALLAGGPLTVDSVDRETGIITCTAGIVATIAAAVAGDFLYIQGDHVTASDKLTAAGLESWLPVTDRSTELAASFFGVTRSTEPVLLGGVYVDGADYTDLNEIVLKLVGKVGKYGGKPDLILMNTERFTDLQRLWLSKHVVFENMSVSVTARAGGQNVTFSKLYSGMMANVGGFVVKVMADRSCPTNRLYALQTNTWKIWHTFDLPGFIMKKEGGRILRDHESQDAMECRIGAYYNLGCSAPGYNGVAELPADL